MCKFLKMVFEPVFTFRGVLKLVEISLAGLDLGLKVLVRYFENFLVLEKLFYLKFKYFY